MADGTVVFPAIAFRQGEWAEQQLTNVDVVFTYELNTYRGETSIQLNVRDLHPTETN